jgi:hypothetical protein
MIGDDGLRLWAWQDHKLTLRCSRESDLLQCLRSGKHKETMYYVMKLMHKKIIGLFLEGNGQDCGKKDQTGKIQVVLASCQKFLII